MTTLPAGHSPRKSMPMWLVGSVATLDSKAGKESHIIFHLLNILSLIFFSKTFLYPKLIFLIFQIIMHISQFIHFWKHNLFMIVKMSNSSRVPLLKRQVCSLDEAVLKAENISTTLSKFKTPLSDWLWTPAILLNILLFMLKQKKIAKVVCKGGKNWNLSTCICS